MTVSITTRRTRSGEERYVVRYRLPGGRAQPVKYGGSFQSREDAEVRRAYIRRLISAGGNPQNYIAATPRLIGRATMVMHRAERHALLAGRSVVDTFDILVALSREKKGRSARVLAELGVTAGMIARAANYLRYKDPAS